MPSLRWNKDCKNINAARFSLTQKQVADFSTPILNTDVAVELVETKVVCGKGIAAQRLATDNRWYAKPIE